MSALTAHYHRECEMVSIPFYSDNELCELLLDASGDCDYLEMDEFLSSRFKDYRVEMFSNNTLKSIGRQLHHAVLSNDSQESLESFLAKLTPIITSTAKIMSNAEMMIQAMEYKLKKKSSKA